MSRNKPLILTILDGWGFSSAVEGNAIAAARKPTYDMLLRDFPNTLVQTSDRPWDFRKGRWAIAKSAI
jgi:2,3-bisphosphoglycerate-independent phosphoglycerate mutase